MQAAGRWRLTCSSSRNSSEPTGSSSPFRSTRRSCARGNSTPPLGESVLWQNNFYFFAFCSYAPIMLVSTLLLSNYSNQLLGEVLGSQLHSASSPFVLAFLSGALCPVRKCGVTRSGSNKVG